MGELKITPSPFPDILHTIDIPLPRHLGFKIPHIGVRGGRAGGAVPPQFGKKNDLFGRIEMLFRQLSSVLKFINGAFECCL